MYLLGVGVALVALALAVTNWALSLQPEVTEANVKRIRPGMTMQQAETILGGPPDGVVIYGGLPPFCTWEGERGRVSVQVSAASGPDRRVIAIDWLPTSSQPGTLARLRAWLGW
jgi:hypothetical protein